MKRPDIAAHLPNALKASASSLSLLQRCDRAWFSEKILELENPSTPRQEASFARGTALHAAIEKFLLDSTSETIDDDLACLASEFLTRLRSSLGLLVEQEMHFEMEGIVVRGFVDVCTDRGILDFKTTSSIYKWGEKRATIPQNLQLMIYAHWWLMNRPEVTEVTIGHLQFQTKGRPEIQLVHRVVDRDHVANYVTRVIAPLLRHQHHVAAAAGLDELIPNRESCGAYGGCPHRATCAKVDAARASVEEVGDVFG